ncbi:MAG: hypothetical protein DLM71_03020 [Chloroflexi bacterium]|nr:MAG: hypothetical protein DLM71_03020 [Chloroflexota bacterium]
MTPARPVTAVERLVLDLFAGDLADPLAVEVAGWLAGSRRFRAFAGAHLDKIRKKLRGARHADARRDVRAELAVAHLLLADPRIELAFEAYGSGSAGPDFTVVFRGERSFNLEVTRLHRPPPEAVDGRQLLPKLRQLPPSMPNAVLVAIQGEAADAFDVAAAIRGLQARADAGDDDFFRTRAFKGVRDFNLRYRRLGGVLVWCEAATGDARAAVWSNPSARIALPEMALRACLLCLRAG